MKRWTYQLPILTYHRVGPLRGDHVPTVSLETFEWQLRFLSRHRFRVLSLDAVIGMLDRGQPVPRHSVAITFDDGYEEVHRIAWPLLKAFGFPAAVFVTPNEVGLPGFATWEQVMEMSRDGIVIGSHTMNHVYLPLVAEDRLEEEISESKRLIERHVGEAVRYLSYPLGGFSPLIQAKARRAGYLAAFTTNRASSRERLDVLAIRRVKVTERDHNLLSFWAKLSGYYDLFRRLESPS